MPGPPHGLKPPHFANVLTPFFDSFSSPAPGVWASLRVEALAPLVNVLDENLSPSVVSGTVFKLPSGLTLAPVNVLDDVDSFHANNVIVWASPPRVEALPIVPLGPPLHRVEALVPGTVPRVPASPRVEAGPTGPRFAVFSNRFLTLTPWFPSGLGESVS